MAVALPTHAGERDLENDAPPSSVEDMETPIKRVFPRVVAGKPLFPGLGKAIEGLPPFLSDTQLEARFRTFYLYKDRTTGQLSEAWAMGGSVYYRSGWLADVFAVELEGFTSQPIYAPADRGGTDLLTDDQRGYGALGIANAKLRYKGLELTGYRQYLELPYVNRNDIRMTPNTYESLTLEKPDGKLRLSTGYTWNIKQRTSEEFVSMTRAIGLDVDRGLAHGGVVWDPTDELHVGAVAAFVPDVGGGVYAEFGAVGPIARALGARVDTQFTYLAPIGDRLLGSSFPQTWNVGARASLSRKGAVLQLGVSVTSESGAIPVFYGSSPSYVDLMQRTFNRADEKAFLASLSYDFAGAGIDGLHAIVNFVAAFDGQVQGVRDDSQELDLTVDYRRKEGKLRGFWLRVRGSWLGDSQGRNGADVRVILRYDFPVL